jgi:hypothetical protein
MKLLEHVFYINLEERTDRKEHAENEFKKIGVTPERINAVRDEHGAIGCSISHIKALELAKHRGYPYILICEDDITFLNPELLLENLHKFENCQESNDWDVIMLIGNVYSIYEILSDFHVRIEFSKTAAGYIVHSRYYDTLLNNFYIGLYGLVNRIHGEITGGYEVDTYWGVLQSVDKWYMIIPKTVTQYPCYSDIEKKHVDYTDCLLNAINL